VYDPQIITPTLGVCLSFIFNHTDRSFVASDIHIRARKAAALSKRASNVLKLTQEKQNLEQELKEMAERLEAIEKKSQELKARGGDPTPPNNASPLPTPPVDS
jgi:hypothetical protein